MINSEYSKININFKEEKIKDFFCLTIFQIEIQGIQYLFVFNRLHNYSSDSAVQSSSQFSLLCSPIFHLYSDFYFELQKLYPYCFMMCQSMCILLHSLPHSVQWKLHAITERTNIICGCCILWKRYRDESGWHGYHSGVLG